MPLAFTKFYLRNLRQEFIGQLSKRGSDRDGLHSCPAAQPGDSEFPARQALLRYCARRHVCAIGRAAVHVERKQWWPAIIGRHTSGYRQGALKISILLK